MNNLPEPTNNEQDNLSKAGQKNYSAAIRTGVIGGIVSFLFALLAIATLFTEHSDSAGLGFFVFGFLAIAVFIISGFIVILISLAGVINYTTLMNRNNDSREESIKGITKSVGLILGIVLALLIAFKLLNIIW
jgi:uncharacterized membrane protein YidH (DUF202 family)